MYLHQPDAFLKCRRHPAYCTPALAWRCTTFAFSSQCWFFTSQILKICTEKKTIIRIDESKAIKVEDAKRTSTMHAQVVCKKVQMLSQHIPECVPSGVQPNSI